MERNRHFMIDIETTGVDLEKDDVLEIGIVEMLPSGDYWLPGQCFHMFVHSPRQPESQFAKEHMAEVYKRANGAPQLLPCEVREQLVTWLAMCGAKGHDVLFCGWNASNFDVPMLNAKGILRRPGYETIDGKDVQVGDHHYRIYEMCGAVQLACDVLRRPYKEVCDEAKVIYPMDLPPGKEHDAIYDCYMQIKILNGLIKMVRGE